MIVLLTQTESLHCMLLEHSLVKLSKSKETGNAAEQFTGLLIETNRKKKKGNPTPSFWLSEMSDQR